MNVMEFTLFQGETVGTQVHLSNCKMCDDTDFGVIACKVPFRIDSSSFANNLNGPLL